MKRIPILLVLALFAAGQERTEPVPILGFETSYIYPGGGHVVVGVLVPTPPPRVIANELSKEQMAKFLEDEKRNEDPEEIEEEIEEPPEEEVLGNHSWTAAVRRGVAKGLAYEIAAREVTADELSGLPVLYVGGRTLSDYERDAVARYVEGGGIVCRIPGRVEPAVERAMRGRFVQRLAADPTAGVRARREGGTLVVNFATAPRKATVVDDEGRVLAKMHDGTALIVPAPKSSAALFTHRVVADWGGGVRRAYPLVDLVGFVERHLRATRYAVAGGTYAVRVHYADAVTGAPAPARHETFTIRRGDGVIARAKGPDVRFAIPDDTAPGGAVLAVGEDEFAISIRREYRISVVTDRGIYRPNDTVHVRALVHRYPSGKPAVGTVKLFNGDGSRHVETSKHGIASWSYPLDEAKPGPRTIVASIAGTTAKTRFTVRAFERPLFDVALDTTELNMRPGEQAPVVLKARFFNGKPVAGATVSADDGIEPREGVLDADGTFRFRVHAKRSARLAFAVRTADGRWRRTSVLVRVADETPRLDVRPVGDLVVGLPATFAITATNRAMPTRVRVDGKKAAVVDGRFEAVPSGTRVNVDADDVLFGFDVLDALFRPARRTAKVGETLRIDVRRPLSLDIMREGVLLRTLAVDGGGLDLALEPDLAGVLDLYAMTEDGGSHARVLVHRDRSVSVDARPDRKEYRPGDIARVEVAVKDAAGRPTAAALGYWAVDEAIIALAPLPDGREATFDAAPANVALGKLRNGRFEGKYGIRHRESQALRKRVARAHAQRNHARLTALRKAYLAAYEKIPFTEMRVFGSFRQHVRWLVKAGYLDATLLRDPWGQPFELSEDSAQVVVSWRAAGPDLVRDTADDIHLRWSCPDLFYDLPARARRFLSFALEALPSLPDTAFTGPTTNAAIGLGGGAGGGFRGRPGRRNLRAGGGHAAPAPTRRDFPPTLVFVPEVLTGPDGRARLDVKLADTITDWRMRLVASSLDQGAGVGFTKLRVTQPMHVDPWIARHLTVGDVIELPVAVRNETEGAFKASVELTVSDHLVIAGARTAQVVVKARETGAHTFLLRAVKPGDAEVTVATVAGDERDRVARIIKVWPDARPVDTAVSSELSLKSPWRAAGSGETRLDLSPGPIADTLTGLDALIREPYG